MTWVIATVPVMIGLLLGVVLVSMLQIARETDDMVDSQYPPKRPPSPQQRSTETLRTEEGDGYAGQIERGAA